MTTTTTTDIKTNLIDEIAKAITAQTITAPVVDALGVTSQVALVVLRAFPHAKEGRLPSVSLKGYRLSRRSYLDEIISVVEHSATEVMVTRRVQRYEMPLQIDLWTQNLTQRMVILPKLVDLFEDDEGLHGLELQLENSFNAAARVHWQNEEEDDEGESGTGIRRCKIMCQVRGERLTQTIHSKATFTYEQELIEPMIIQTRDILPAPYNPTIVAPSIVTDASIGASSEAGDFVVATPAVVSGTTPFTRSYQWHLEDSIGSGTYSPISGQTNTFLSILVAYESKGYFIVETITGPGEDSVVSTSNIATVDDGVVEPTVPVNTSPPSLPFLETGVEATASPGTWTNATTVTAQLIVNSVAGDAGYTHTPTSEQATLVAILRETAVNGDEVVTQDSAPVTIQYNPVAIAAVTNWATLRRSVGLSDDDPVEVFSDQIGGDPFSAPTTGNAPTFDSGPPPALQFDESDDYMESATLATYDFLYKGNASIFFTISGEFNISQYLFTQGNTSPNSTGIAILVTANDIRFYLSNGGDQLYAIDHNISLSTGDHSIGLAWDLVDCKLYVDGALVLTQPLEPGSPAYATGDSTYKGRVSNSFLPWKRKVSDIVCANSKLTTANMLELHNNLGV